MGSEVFAGGVAVGLSRALVTGLVRVDTVAGGLFGGVGTIALMVTNRRILVGVAVVLAGCAGAPVGDVALEVASLVPLGVRVRAVEYRGRGAVEVTKDEGAPSVGIAIVGGTAFVNGTIDVDLAGEPGAAASPTARGFVGIAFRVQREGERFEAMYLRPTNGRADDQLRRNHSTQYISYPDYPWERLRSETPGKYESYVDLVPGAWTSVRIVVDASRARLFVGGADQPCLVVDDLKLGEVGGSIALWIGGGTVARFANLRVTAKQG